MEIIIPANGITTVEEEETLHKLDSTGRESHLANTAPTHSFTTHSNHRHEAGDQNQHRLSDSPVIHTSDNNLSLFFIQDKAGKLHFKVSCFGPREKCHLADKLSSSFTVQNIVGGLHDTQRVSTQCQV